MSCFDLAILDLKQVVEIDQNEDERIRLSEILFDCERYKEAIAGTSVLFLNIIPTGAIPSIYDFIVPDFFFYQVGNKDL